MFKTKCFLQTRFCVVRRLALPFHLFRPSLDMYWSVVFTSLRRCSLAIRPKLKSMIHAEFDHSRVRLGVGWPKDLIQNGCRKNLVKHRLKPLQYCHCMLVFPYIQQKKELTNLVLFQGLASYSYPKCLQVVLELNESLVTHDQARRRLL